MNNRKKLILARFAFQKYAINLAEEITRDLFSIFFGLLWLVFSIISKTGYLGFEHIVVFTVIFTLAIKSYTSYHGYHKQLSAYKRAGYDVSKFTPLRRSDAHAS